MNNRMIKKKYRIGKLLNPIKLSVAIDEILFASKVLETQRVRSRFTIAWPVSLTVS